MPRLQIADVISFSSEDPVHVAANVLNSDPSKKWKCQKPGEKSANVILQLNRASIISSIDIGNENSAYIEVLVNRTGFNSDYFKVLLVMSSFMSPVEARQGTNANKVRMFSKEQLSKPECEEKWDRIKIVCTQPFNSHAQFGLSFINLYTQDEKESAPSNPANFGKFSLRSESPTGNISTGSLFARRKEISNEPLKVAAAIREASSSTSQIKLCTKRKQSGEQLSKAKKPNVYAQDEIPKARNRDEILYAKDEEEPNERIEKVIKREEERVSAKVNLSTVNVPKGNNSKHNVLKVNNDKYSNISSNSKGNASKVNVSITKNVVKPAGNSQNQPDSQNRQPKKTTRIFSELLRDVVFVISGIQNPDRAELRTAALMMGAKYKPDWDNTCTHLICAFPNTPKFNQVKGHGKIVTKKWILDCKLQRKKIPWRRYALDRDDKIKVESEEEICEFIPSLQAQQPSRGSRIVDEDVPELRDEPKRINEPEMRELELRRDNEPKINRQSLPEINRKNEAYSIKNEPEIQSDGGSDTDDEIERIQVLQHIKDNDDYNANTDEEIVKQPTNGQATPILPDYFTNKIFFIDEDMPDKVLLKRYIVALNGVVLDELCSKITTVISSPETVPVLKQIHPSADFINLDWIFQCHNLQELVPLEEFML